MTRGPCPARAGGLVLAWSPRHASPPALENPGEQPGVEVAPAQDEASRFPASWSRGRRHPASAAAPRPLRGCGCSSIERMAATRSCSVTSTASSSTARSRATASACGSTLASPSARRLALRPEMRLLGAKTPPAPGTLPTATPNIWTAGDMAFATAPQPPATARRRAGSAARRDQEPARASRGPRCPALAAIHGSPPSSESRPPLRHELPRPALRLGHATAIRQHRPAPQCPGSR